MLFTITTTRAPATDLGYLLHKHPDRPQSFEVASGTAHVFYPEAAPERCTAALLLDIDPIALVRGHKNGELTEYVNDRPYAAASMLAVAIKEAFRTALAGRCDARPDLAAAPIPLAIEVTALRCRGGPELTHRVFAPLGWTVDTRTQPFTPREWGDSPYLGLRLTGQARLADALRNRRPPRRRPRLRRGRAHQGPARGEAHRARHRRRRVRAGAAAGRQAAEARPDAHECVFAILALESEPVDPRL